MKKALKIIDEFEKKSIKAGNIKLIIIDTQNSQKQVANFNCNNLHFLSPVKIEKPHYTRR